MSLNELTKQVRLRQWADDINNRLNSGMRVRQWCSEQGISQKTYYYRLRRVREEAIAKVPGKQLARTEKDIFSEVDNSSPVSFAEITCNKYDGNATSAITVHFGNSVLEINNVAEQETIIKTLIALKSIC